MYEGRAIEQSSVENSFRMIAESKLIAETLCGQSQKLLSMYHRNMPKDQIRDLEKRVILLGQCGLEEICDWNIIT